MTRTREDLIEALAEQILQHGILDGLVLRFDQHASLAHELATTLADLALEGQKLSIRALNLGLTPADKVREKAVDGAFLGVCESFGATGNVSGDPRGCVYSITFNDHHQYRLNCNLIIYGED